MLNQDWGLTIKIIKFLEGLIALICIDFTYFLNLNTIFNLKTQNIK